MENTTTTETETRPGHPFERAGLGRAPFRFIGMEEQDLCYGQAILNREEYQKTGILVTTKPGGSCAYCGTYIVNMYNIKSADGRKFHVGSECVNKTGDKKLIAVVKKAAAVVATKARHTREAAQLVDGIAFLGRADVAAFLATVPHPIKFRAEQGETLADSIAWMMKNAGTSGKLRTIANARKAFGK